MDIFGKSTLEREGAQAAAGGASWRSNPFLLRENMPGATGEALAAWSGRHDAWQRGFEGYFQLGPDFARRPKEALSGAVLKTLVERRVHWLLDPRAYAAAPARSMLRVPMPAGHERDHAGRNWNMDLLEHDAGHDAQLEPEFRSVVERLRHQYDLVPAAEFASGWRSATAVLHATRLEPEAPTSGTGVPITECGSLTAGPGPDSPGAADVTDPQHSSAPLDESPQRLRELGIRRIGWRYEYRGYRYDRLADALAYARLPRNVDELRQQIDLPLAPDEPPLAPCAEDLALMAEWGITFDAGVYRLGTYRYDRLADAVAYASRNAPRR